MRKRTLRTADPAQLVHDLVAHLGDHKEAVSERRAVIHERIADLEQDLSNLRRAEAMADAALAA